VTSLALLVKQKTLASSDFSGCSRSGTIRSNAFVSGWRSL